MQVHSQVAVHQAARVASNPYRRNFNRGNLHVQNNIKEKIVRVIKKLINVFAPIWKKPQSTRTVRRIVKAVVRGANKDDPHLERRV